MAVISVPGISDAIVTDGVTQFDKVNSFGRSNLLAADELKYALNVDVDVAEGIQTRRGVQSLGDALASGPVQGGVFFDTPAKQRLLMVAGGGVYSFDGTAWTLLAGYSVGNAVRRLCCAMAVDQAVFSDGVNPMETWDGTTFVSLGVYAGDLDTKPPLAKYIGWYGSAMFAAGNSAEPDALWRSDFLEPGTWNHGTQKIRIGGGEGDPITGFCEWTNNFLVVGKRNHMYLVLADPATPMGQWQIKPVGKNVGCVSHRSMVQVADDVLWLARDGVRSMMYTNQANTQTVAEPLSRPIQDIIDQINWSAADKATGFYWRNRYILSIPIGTSIEPNYVIVYNTITAGWSGFWTGWNATTFVASFLNGDARLVIGAADGTVSQWMDYVPAADESLSHYLDRGAAYPSEFLTRGMNWSDFLSPKKGYSLELEFFRSLTAATVNLVLDQGEPQQFWYGDTFQGGFSRIGDPLPWSLMNVTIFRKADDLLHYGSFRELQINVRAESGKMAVRSLIATAFMEAIVPTI